MTRPAHLVPAAALARGSAPASGPTALDPDRPGRPGRRGRTARRGPGAGAGRARGELPALAVLLAATAALYLWDLSASGWANSFYAAAVKAGSESWTAWFFGSLDPESFITVDKPPASLWVMGLSARLFGFSSWSLLAPQALEGVLAVGTLYAAVRRWHGPRAGLLAGAALALTPAAALMFRFDNPDALLVLLMTVAAYLVVRALEHASWRWLALAGVAIGFAFLTKMLQGFLVLPAFGLVYLLAAPTGLGRRVLHLLGAAAAVVVAAGWWVLLVTFWPGTAPYIGGSTDGSVMDLVLGYNGLGRILGGGGGGGGGMSGGATGSSFGGAATWQRLFSSEFGNEISWLLPAALVALVFGLALTWRAPRTDRTRASFVLWGGWLLVSGGVFAYMEGTVHPYYTVALAPAVAALVAIGGQLLWTRRDRLSGRVGLGLLVTAATVWGFVLLQRNDTYLVLSWLVLLVGVLAAAGLVITPVRMRRVAVLLVLSGVLAGGAGTASYAVATAATPHSGSIPTVGPAAAGAGGGFGGMSGMPGAAGRTEGSEGSTAALTELLQGAGTRWSAAVSGSQSAASLMLSSGTAVMAMGGWSDDPTPTLAQFQAYVAAGEVHYLVAGGGGTGTGGRGGDGTVSEVTTWVAQTFASSTVDGYTVYDLTRPVGGGDAA
ncbi:glycosyltransferase family 39 protein [Kineococcus gynurae]|uniref:Glycosyltransferase family 39 protein n=1 Tax=Kineococcus gynurae TaxID=452979 RepID=A0ABV5LWU7_9ACTN